MVCMLDLLVMCEIILLSIDLVGSLCDVVQSIACELFVNQEHVTFLSLLESLVLLTKTYKKVLKRPLTCGAYKLHPSVTVQNTQYILAWLDVAKMC